MKEHQLLKDRRKNVKKRPSQGENSPPAASSTVSNQSRGSGQDARTIKLVLVDSQNIQKLGSGKTSFKRNVNVGVNRSNNKGDSTNMKPARQRRKAGNLIPPRVGTKFLKYNYLLLCFHRKKKKKKVECIIFLFYNFDSYLPDDLFN